MQKRCMKRKEHVKVRVRIGIPIELLVREHISCHLLSKKGSKKVDYETRTQYLKLSKGRMISQVKL